MKKFIFSSSLLLISLVACDDEAETITIDTSKPEGTFSVSEMGTFMEQNGTGTTGTVELGDDSNGVQFLRFASNFTTNLATGTVTVYLSTSMDYIADPGNGNPDLRLVGVVGKAGENFYKLDPEAASNFTHVILWCGSANIPFGYAMLQ